jgi:hypothetical protein
MSAAAQYPSLSVYPKLGINIWKGEDGGDYLGNCKTNWDHAECPTAGWDVVIDNALVNYGNIDPNDETYSEGDTIRIVGAGSSLRIMGGTFKVGGKQMTAAPTPAPTTNPTPAPTPSCAVTCEHDNGQWVVGGGREKEALAMGHKAGAFDKMGHFGAILSKLAGCDLSKNHGNYGKDLTAPLSKHFKKADHNGCNWRDRRAGRIVATHDVAKLNSQSSFTKHRCYTVDGKCVCECLDDAEAPWDFNKDGVVDANDNRFQDGTIQNKDGGKHSAKFTKQFDGQEIYHSRKQKFNSLFKPKNVAGEVQYEEFNGNWNGAGEHTVSALETTTAEGPSDHTGMNNFYGSR